MRRWRFGLRQVLIVLVATIVAMGAITTAGSQVSFRFPSIRPTSPSFTAEALDLPELMVMMVRSDGVVIARWPAVPVDKSRLDQASALSKAMAAGEMQGIIEGVASVDGEERVNAFRRLERYPIHVLAGIDREAIIAGWQRQLAVLAAFTFPISMALVYVAWVALRRRRRELAAQQSLHM